MSIPASTVIIRGDFVVVRYRSGPRVEVVRRSLGINGAMHVEIEQASGKPRTISYASLAQHIPAKPLPVKLGNITFSRLLDDGAALVKTTDRLCVIAFDAISAGTFPVEGDDVDERTTNYDAALELFWCDVGVQGEQ